MSAVELQIEQHEGGLLVRPDVVRMDHKVAESFESELMPHVEAAAAVGGRVIIDFSSVEYISSVGLRVLNVALRYTRKNGGQIVITGLGATLSEIFEIARFHLLFNIYSAVDEALAAPSDAEP
mgnify:CR=1 FL=1